MDPGLLPHIWILLRGRTAKRCVNFDMGRGGGGRLLGCPLRGVTDRCSAFGVVVVAPPVTHALGPGKTVAAALTAAVARMRKSAKERKQRIVGDGTG